MTRISDSYNPMFSRQLQDAMFLTWYLLDIPMGNVVFVKELNCERNFMGDIRHEGLASRAN